MTTPGEQPGAADGGSDDEPSASPPEASAPPEALAPPTGGRRRWLRVAAFCLAFTLLVAAGAVWYLYRQLDSNIHTDTTTGEELKRVQSERPSPAVTSAENILLIGTDNRGDGNSKYGQDSGTQRSDTTILLHLSADRGSATAVSIPRDLMVDIPACRRTSGSGTTTRTKPQFAQFNWAFQFGGAACTIRTVENLTGIRVDHHLIVDFTGFKKMVDAVDGVEVCVPHAVHDEDAHLDLRAGRQVLNGEQALGYVRARQGIGDGSDTQRMDRQQEFMASLVRKISSTGVLLNPVKLYPLLDAATSSLTADPGLDSLKELYDLASGLQRTPTDQVRFLTVPRRPYVQDPNRDELVQPEADELFTTLRDDGEVVVATESTTESGPAKASPSGTSSATSPSPSPSPSPSSSPKATGPTYRGTTADRDGLSDCE